MIINANEVPPRELYGHMVSCITPRPIAWVSSLSANNVSNLAPYSFFNGVGVNPPTLLFSSVNKRDGEKKDTVINIQATKEFTVNIVNFEMAEVMNQSSFEYAEDVSEFEACGIETVKGDKIRVPGVAKAPVRMECELYKIISIGEGPLAANLVIGRILNIHIKDDILSEGKIDPAKLDTIGRLGGSAYSRTTDRFDLPRPTL
jgi:flavin reductase (DIM6/NTAB) family NADH-FMN oxidoreductase RutF